MTSAVSKRGELGTRAAAVKTAGLRVSQFSLKMSGVEHDHA
jgi:hypothetical protein